MVAAKIANLGDGQRADRSIDPATTQPEAAALLNVSLKSVKRARKVRESGDASLIADVESGKITVSAAALHVAAVTRYPDKAKEARPWKATPLRFSVHTEASATNKLRPFLRLDPRMCQIVDFALDLEPRRFILRLIQPVELRP